MTTFIETLSKQHQSLVTQFRLSAKATIASEFTKLFQNCQMIRAFRWTQYTQYFNDGDECSFNVHDPQYKILKSSLPTNCPRCKSKLNPQDKFCAQCGAQTTSTINESDWLESYDLNALKNPALDAELTNFKLNLCSHEDMLLLIYGDHAQITATSAGTTVAKYNDHS